jgi:hypothetical protein
MRRFTELFIWIAVLALFALFVGGTIYSFVFPEDRPHVDHSGWQGK